MWGPQHLGRSEKALLNSGIRGKAINTQSSSYLLPNWPNRHFWTEIIVYLGIEGCHLRSPLFAFPQNHPDGLYAPSNSPSGRGGLAEAQFALPLDGTMLRVHLPGAASGEGPQPRREPWGCYLLGTLNGKVLGLTPPLHPWHFLCVLPPLPARSGGGAVAEPLCRNAAQQQHGPHLRPPAGAWQALLQCPASLINSSKTTTRWLCLWTQA